MAATTATVNLVTTEQLANSIGGTIVANTLRVSNATANGSTIEFMLTGQSLPLAGQGSSTILPGVLVNVYIGNLGTTADTLVLSAPVVPTIDQNGAFVVSGLLTLRGNGASGGGSSGNANAVWTGMAQVPGVALGGVSTVKTVYAFPTSNGASNVGLVAGANTSNVTFWVQPQEVSVNCNTSITSIVAWTSNGSGTAVI